MPVDIDFKVSNYSRVMKAILGITDGRKYRGYMKDAITTALRDLTSYANRITHKETGTLASGHKWEYDSHTMRGRIFIAPWAIKVSGNTLQWANVYGVFEHRRGGKHAFYDRTMREKAPMTIIRELNANVKIFDL